MQALLPPPGRGPWAPLQGIRSPAHSKDGEAWNTPWQDRGFPGQRSRLWPSRCRIPEITGRENQLHVDTEGQLGPAMAPRIGDRNSAILGSWRPGGVDAGGPRGSCGQRRTSCSASRPPSHPHPPLCSCDRPPGACRFCEAPWDLKSAHLWGWAHQPSGFTCGARKSVQTLLQFPLPKSLPPHLMRQGRSCHCARKSEQLN